MKRFAFLLVLLAGCVWDPFGPREPVEPCVTTVYTTLIETPTGLLLRTDSITYTGDPPCIELTEVVE